MSFFSSRWVETPGHVRSWSRRAAAGLPPARRRGGPQAGGARRRRAVLRREDNVSAARFTSNARVGAPVIVSQQARPDRLRAVVANSGGSNTGDGQRGIETALATQRPRPRRSAWSPSRWASRPPA